MGYDNVEEDSAGTCTQRDCHIILCQCVKAENPARVPDIGIAIGSLRGQVAHPQCYRPAYKSNM